MIFLFLSFIFLHFLQKKKSYVVLFAFFAKKICRNMNNSEKNFEKTKEIMGAIKLYFIHSESDHFLQSTFVAVLF